MRLLRLAVENQRWDLAAHTIVLVTARLLNNVAQGRQTATLSSKSIGRGDKPHASKSREKKRRSKGQSER